MNAHSEHLNTNLAAVLTQIRGSLPPLQRATLEVLVISLVHARDTANSLVCYFHYRFFYVFDIDSVCSDSSECRR